MPWGQAMTDTTVVAFKRPQRRALTGADRLAASHVIFTIARTLNARCRGMTATHPTIKSMWAQLRSIAYGLKLFPAFHLYPTQRTMAPFSDMEMQNMLDGLNRLIEIIRPCHGTARAVTAAKRLRDMLLRENWRYARCG
jgi:hypothetical protein